MPPTHSSLENSFPPAPSAFLRLLPFLWLTRVSTTACSFRKRCSSHSTSWSFSSNHWNTQVQIFNGGDSYRLQHRVSLRDWITLKESLYSEKCQDSSGLLNCKTEGAGEAERHRATHNVWFIHLDGHFADCVRGFVEHLEETSATQCLGTHGAWQLQDQEGGDGKLSAAPILGSEELVSIRWHAPNLPNKLFEM